MKIDLRVATHPDDCLSANPWIVSVGLSVSAVNEIFFFLSLHYCPTAMLTTFDSENFLAAPFLTLLTVTITKAVTSAIMNAMRRSV